MGGTVHILHVIEFKKDLLESSQPRAESLLNKDTKIKKQKRFCFLVNRFVHFKLTFPKAI